MDVMTRVRLRLRRFPRLPPPGRNSYERITVGIFGHFELIPTVGGETNLKWSRTGLSTYYATTEEARAAAFRVALDVLGEAVEDVQRQIGR